MSPRTNEQYQAIRKEKRRMIMNAGLELFSEHGFNNTSIRQIADRANISKGLLYNYFESKDDLLQNILKEGMDELMHLYDAKNNGEMDASGMELFIKDTFRLLNENQEYWRLYFQIILQAGVNEQFQASMAKVYERIMKISIQYFSNMGFQNPQAEALMFGALMDGLSFQFVVSPDQFPLDMIRDTLIQKYCTSNN